MSSPSPADASALVVEIANRQSAIDVDTERLIEAVRQVVTDAGYVTGELSVAVVDDPTIQRLNRQYLQHDYPTDVLAFVLEEAESHIEGEIVLSVETAARNGTEYGQSLRNEILLCVIHGALHLVGYADNSPQAVEQMRAAEKQYMKSLGDGCSQLGRTP